MVKVPDLAKITLLAALGTGLWFSPCQVTLAADSTNVDISTIRNFKYEPFRDFPAVTITFGGRGLENGRFCFRSAAVQPTVNSPSQLYGTTTGNNAFYTVPFSGYYTVRADLVWGHSGPYPGYVWVDDWAVTRDFSKAKKNTDIRLFYSGDVPIQTSEREVKIYMFGAAYLASGAEIYLPRVWTTPDSGAWCMDGSMTITLLRSP